MREIDSRVIDAGSTTTCHLFLSDEGYTVEIHRDTTVLDGEPLSDGVRIALVYEGSDGEEALDAYRHPLARRTTLNVFDGESEIVERVNAYVAA